MSEFDLPDRQMPRAVFVAEPGMASVIRNSLRLTGWNTVKIFNTNQRIEVFEYLGAHAAEIDLFFTDSRGCGTINNAGIQSDYILAGRALEFAPQAYRVVMSCCDNEIRQYQFMERDGFIDARIGYPNSGYLKRILSGYDRAIENRTRRKMTEVLIAAAALGILPNSYPEQDRPR